jgi:hypothetical protein
VTNYQLGEQINIQIRVQQRTYFVYLYLSSAFSIFEGAGTAFL